MIAVVPVKPPQINIFAPGNERFRQIRGAMKRVMPTPPVLREGAAAIAGHRGIQHDQFAHVFRVGRGENERDRAAPVMGHEVVTIELQMIVNEFANIVRNSCLVIAVERAR